jgi:hypothetical protein
VRVQLEDQFGGYAMRVFLGGQVLRAPAQNQATMRGHWMYAGQLPPKWIPRAQEPRSSVYP